MKTEKEFSHEQESEAWILTLKNAAKDTKVWDKWPHKLKPKLPSPPKATSEP